MMGLWISIKNYQKKVTRKLKIFDQDKTSFELWAVTYGMSENQPRISASPSYFQFSELKPNFNVYRYVTLCISYTVNLFLSRSQ